MALRELRDRLGRSLEQMHNTAMMDETTLKNRMNEITGALLDADFPKLLVDGIERRILEIISLPAASNKGRLIYGIIFDALSSMLDPGKSAIIIQEKLEPSVVMFVGLRGVGKTEMCAKYARFHRKKGFRPGLVCADTSRIDAFLRLEKAAKDEVPVYGSYTSDPATIATEGIEKFTKEKRDLIIVDTNGRHKRYSALFQEMRQLAEAMKPDLVILVMDSSIGLVDSSDQAHAFKQSFDVGAVILANMKGNSKAGGALSAVAAAKCPMILAETGDKSKEFEAFEVEPFVRRLLKNPWVDKTCKWDYTLRSMYISFKRKLRSDKKPPRLPSHTPASGPQLNLETMRLYIAIMDSMTDEELDRSNIKQMSEERVMEIAKGSKVDVRQVMDMMETYQRKAKACKEVNEKIFKTLEDLEDLLMDFDPKSPPSDSMFMAALWTQKRQYLKNTKRNEQLQYADSCKHV